jgi:membrane protein DedA with SNARE-associated domain
MLSTFEMLLESCGYLATFVGVMMEGEVSLVSSVIGAKSGLYNFWVAAFLAWLGAWTADWFKFLVARKKGTQLLLKKPKLQAKLDKISIWYDKQPEAILLVYKMFFGLTTLILILTGLRKISYLKFAIYSGISVAIWTGTLAGLAYYFAETLLENIQLVSDNILPTMGILFVVAFLIWLFVKRPYQKACLDCPELET